MIKIGDIICFRGGCGVVTHITLKHEMTSYTIMTSDGEMWREIVTDQTPKEYLLYKTGLHINLTDLFLEIHKAYQDEAVQMMLNRKD